MQGGRQGHRQAHETDINLPILNHERQILHRQFHRMQMHPRPQAGKLLDLRLQHAGIGCGTDIADFHPPDLAAPGPAPGILGAFEPGQHGARLLQEHLTRRSEAHRAFGPRQQLR